MKVNHFLLAPLLSKVFSHVHFSDKLKPLRIGSYKILDRLSEPLFYPHLHNFMRFSDSTQFNMEKLNKSANSDSTPFNSDESLSDEDYPQKPNIPSTTSNYDFTTPSSNESYHLSNCMTTHLSKR